MVTYCESRPPLECRILLNPLVLDTVCHGYRLEGLQNELPNCKLLHTTQ